MTAFCGVGASVKEATTAFTNSSKWTLSVKNATKDVTPIGAPGSWAVYLGTLNSWTCKISCWLDEADAAQAALLATMGTTIPLTLNVNGVPNGFTGSAIFNGIDPSVDAQSPETVDFSFQGSGPLTFA